jgi:hypothetical protein
MRRQIGVVLGLGATIALAVGLSGTAAGADTGSGGAFGIQVSVLGGTVTVPPTPAVNFPPGGSQSLVNVNAGGVSAGVLNVSSQGDSAGNVASSASVLNAQVPGFLTATAVSSQCASTPTVAGGSSVLNASTPAGPVAVNPAPNTSIPVIVGSLILNEQQGGSNSIRVRAVHVAAAPLADVILAESDCGITLVGAATATAARATTTSGPAAAGAAMPPLTG